MLSLGERGEGVLSLGGGSAGVSLSLLSQAG